VTVCVFSDPGWSRPIPWTNELRRWVQKYDHHLKENDMSLTIAKPEESESNFTLMPEGTHAAVCTWIVDIGPQELEYQGEVSEKPRVRIRFEVPDERVTWTDSDGNEHEGPMVIWKEYTASLHEKATLRQHLARWRGRDFTEVELMGFDLKNILGKPCMISVIHKTSQAGKPYAQIDSVSKLMKGLDPQPEGELKVFDFDSHTDEELAELPQWLQEKVLDGKALLERQRSRTRQYATVKEIQDEVINDDIPF